MSNRTRLLLSAAVAASSLTYGAWSCSAAPEAGTDIAPTTAPAGAAATTHLGTGQPLPGQPSPSQAGPSTAESPYTVDLRRADATAGTVSQSTSLPTPTPPPSDRPLMSLLGRTPAGDFLHQYNI